MQVLTSLMLAVLACAGFCAVLIGNPTIGLHLRNSLPTTENIFSEHWLSWILRPSQRDSQRAWTNVMNTRDWNMLYHVGGNGPWIQKMDDVVQEGFDPPKRCKVEQVHMVSRAYLQFIEHVENWH